MLDPFLGQISLVPYNFAPRGWAFCNGQLMQIADNQALFALLGTTYGGDGRTNFALPDLRGRSVIHNGSSQGLGLDPTFLGQRGGVEYVQLSQQHLPSHSHEADFTPTFDNSSSGGDGTADLKVANEVPDSTSTSTAKSLSSKLAGGMSGTPLISTVDATTTIKDAVTGIDAGGSSMTGGNVTIGDTGGNQYFPIKDPFLVMNYVIAIQGQFPSRS